MIRPFPWPILSPGFTEWDARAGAEAQKELEAHDRSTIYRWLQGRLPGNAETLLSLSGLLDVDPLALLDLPDAGIDHLIQRLVGGHQRDQFPKPALRFLGSLIRSTEAWPPPEVSNRFFGRPWTLFEFEHPAGDRKGYFACIDCCRSDQDRAGPTVYHIAYRRRLPVLPPWIPYGAIIRKGTALRLIHSSGYNASTDIAPDDPLVPMATWFGEGPAHFRIACLHPFEATVRDLGDEEVLAFPP